MPREEMLARIRSSLGRSPKEPAPAPPVWLNLTKGPDAVARFSEALAALGCTAILARSLTEARDQIVALLRGRRFVASNAPILGALGALDFTRPLGFAAAYSREACETAEIGLTSADFALADTGTLVFLSESHESRLISLLPPRHIAVIERAKILESLDELLDRVPDPAAQSSSLVLVTGPSRTGDIEMRLVRGVHGPGELTVLILGDVTAS